MTKPVTTEPEASIELAEALYWYETRRGGLGAHFLHSVDRAVQLITEFPTAGSPVAGGHKELGIRRFGIPGFPYQLVYIEMEVELRILAFAHESRQQGYWRRRVLV